MLYPPSSRDSSGYRQARARADRVVLTYVAAAALWVLLSDRALELLVADPARRALLGTFKGWVFVAVTAALLLALLRRWAATTWETHAREQQGRHLLQAIVENASEAIIAKDRDSRYLLCNPAASRRLGKTPAEVLGRDDRALFPPAQAEALIAMDRQVMAEGRVQTQELRLDTVQGPRVILLTKGPLRDAQGAISGVFSLSRDITERTQAEEALRDREHKLQAIVTYSPSALTLKDREGRYVLANPNAQRLLRRDEAQILGRTDADFHAPQVARVLQAHDEQVLRGGERQSVEETVPVDGEPRLFLAHRFPVRDGGGDIRYVCRIAFDITERRQAELALSARNEELERFNRVMVGRELDMIGLKRQVNALSLALGRPAPYPLAFDAADTAPPRAAGNAGAAAP